MTASRRLTNARAGRLFWLDGFLSAQRCARVLEELEFAFWSPSTVVRRTFDGELHSFHSGTRVSETTHQEWFSAGLQREIRVIEQRLIKLIGCRPDRYEEWQATRYRTGGKFEYHFDSGYWADEPAGDREKTILIYLETPARGGSTKFRELDVDVKPQAGRLLVWDNLLPGGGRDPNMLHASVPVARGRKTVLVTWVRQRSVRAGR